MNIDRREFLQVAGAAATLAVSPVFAEPPAAKGLVVCRDITYYIEPVDYGELSVNRGTIVVRTRDGKEVSREMLTAE